jgi:hypothetical protein
MLCGGAVWRWVERTRLERPQPFPPPAGQDSCMPGHDAPATCTLVTRIASVGERGEIQNQLPTPGPEADCRSPAGPSFPALQLVAGILPRLPRRRCQAICPHLTEPRQSMVLVMAPRVGWNADQGARCNVFVMACNPGLGGGGGNASSS